MIFKYESLYRMYELKAKGDLYIGLLTNIYAVMSVAGPNTKALHAFFQVLEQYTVKDLINNEHELRELMGIE
ncbi:hypothetical protein [Oceanobacillus chungangensis]|uniref:hypothetical protein n=1 Tax=Oceanobacillus chungangensis TaxID=1229152 RepID=UPI002482DC2E|nr:hypothetical protein [Oceanobacillus chungangensis]